MPKGLYFTVVVFILSFVRRLISEVTERIATELCLFVILLLFSHFVLPCDGEMKLYM